MGRPYLHHMGRSYHHNRHRSHLPFIMLSSQVAMAIGATPLSSSEHETRIKIPMNAGRIYFIMYVFIFLNFQVDITVFCSWLPKSCRLLGPMRSYRWSHPTYCSAFRQRSTLYSRHRKYPRLPQLVKTPLVPFPQ